MKDNPNKMKNWKKYSFEFLSIFIAVISAFALNNWNENRKNNIAESKILTEIYNGLEKDLNDIDENLLGHKMGNQSVNYFRDFISKKPIEQDSLLMYYFSLTRDFISIQNTSGYETLKSRGLELIKDDTLRTKIISLYEYDFNYIRKLEEEYYEMQFQQNYFKEINQTLSKCFIFDSNNKIIGIDINKKIEEDEKRIILTYLWKIKTNRNFVMSYYEKTKLKIIDLMKNIKNGS